jgi:hypothetical protein
LSRKLTEFEKKVYDFIKEHNEMIVSNVPKNMSGAIPNLKNAGLLETFRKAVSPRASKKKTFVKAIKKEREVKGYSVSSSGSSQDTVPR